MVEIPAGSFLMGSNEGEADEKPVHRVTLDGYCLDVTEVTVGAYARCTGCAPPRTGDHCNVAGQGKDDHPQNCVDWTDASTYCASVGGRLPTEGEWEYAARGGAEGRLYPWGSAAPSAQSACWNRVATMEGTCRAGSFPADAFGLHDMAGNVWEWTADWTGDYPSVASRNHAGPASGSSRVDRGGCWRSGDAASLRGSDRGVFTPDGWSDYLGFRCAGTR